MLWDLFASDVVCIMSVWKKHADKRGGGTSRKKEDEGDNPSNSGSNDSLELCVFFFWLLSKLVTFVCVCVCDYRNDTNFSHD